MSSSMTWLMKQAHGCFCLCWKGPENNMKCRVDTVAFTSSNSLHTRMLPLGINAKNILSTDMHLLNLSFFRCASPNLKSSKFAHTHRKITDLAVGVTRHAQYWSWWSGWIGRLVWWCGWRTCGQTWSFTHLTQNAAGSIHHCAALTIPI